MRAAPLFLFSLVLTASLTCAQTSSAPAQASPASLPNHGLVLRAALGSGPDPIGPVEMRKCLARHPPLACVGFNYTLDNNGNETILVPWWSCPPSYPEVEYKAPDGSWIPFPVRPGILSCTANIGGLGLIRPGKGAPSLIRLAYILLDTVLPDPAGQSGTNQSGTKKTDGVVTLSQQISGNGYALLSGNGPCVIRLRQTIQGCVTKQPLSEKDLPTVPYSRDDVAKLCVDPKPPYIFVPLVVLESNELALTVPSAPQ